MPPKRQSSASSSTTTTTATPLPGASNGGSCPADDFTRTVKKRLATSSRTGQACDRCKVRKIRCDGLPGGCSPCIQNRTECRTTDRISQKAIPRGYVESLEARCATLEAKNKELEAALTRVNLEGRSNGYSARGGVEWGLGVKPGPDGWSLNRKPYPASQQNNYSSSTTCCSNSTPERLCQTMRSASFRPGNTGSHYLGISSGNQTLSSIKASALSLLGIDIDLSDLDPSEPNNSGHANDESFSSCLATIFNVNPNVPKVELPPRDEAFEYVKWFFVISHPYLPILHRPTFVKMLDRMYTDKTYEPTPAQIVMVHMVFAIVHFQNATRDRMKSRGHSTPAEIEVMHRSRLHYHYALSFFYGLLSHSTLEDLQAIGLILQHLRAFPKPGGSWLLSRIAISLCFELGLHRSPQKYVLPGSTQNFIEMELRKRIFWSILTLEVSLSARLGRPMAIREADYDVEYPERIDDEYITESGILKREESTDDCAFDVAIEMFKFTALYIEVLATLYAPARPSREKYVALVQDLEAKLMKWRDQTPRSLASDAPKMEKRFQAAHLHSWFHEYAHVSGYLDSVRLLTVVRCRILMRHPSLSLSPSPSFTNDCIAICVESSRKILHLTDELRKGSHYLDTTWSGTTIQLLATLTILFSVWQKRDTVTSEEVIQVKADMDLCMDIMGDVGSLLGSPNRLREVVQVLTHGTMELLNRKRDNNQRPPSNPYQAYSGGPQNFATPTGTPVPPLKVPTSSQMSDHFQGPVFPPDRPNTHFSDCNVVQLPSPDIDLGPLTSNTAPIYNSQNLFAQAPPPPPPAYPPSTDASQQPGPFAWSWAGNESWREYMHSISSMAGELDPTETYSASALIALNRDCDNQVSTPPPHAGSHAHSHPHPHSSHTQQHPLPLPHPQHTHPHAHAHTHTHAHGNNVSAPGIVLNTVTAAESPARSPFHPPTTETAGPPWGPMIGSYGFTDGQTLRGVGTAGENGVP